LLRLRAVLAELTSYVALNQGELPAGKKRMMWVLKRVANDAIEEMAEVDPNIMSVYFNYMGSVISWIGHGEDDKLPDSVKEFLQARTGTEDPEAIDNGINAELPTADSNAR
jgi:hypothetical protein